MNNSDVPPRKLRIGEMLVQKKCCTVEQRDLALVNQKKSGKRLGKVLIEMGAVNEEDLVHALSEQLRVPFLDLATYLIDPVIARLVPEHIARRHLLIAINKVGNKLSVAMEDPLNIIAIDDIQLLTGLMVKPVLATTESLNKAIQETYRGGIRSSDPIDLPAGEMKLCRCCGQKILSGAAYSEKDCRSCGKKIDGKASYCQYCGHCQPVSF